jgi:AcrR family transcriptional regulator
MGEKHMPDRRGQYGTFGGNRPETPDRRIRRTKASLHDALIGLAHEKPYPAIAVKEILDRANVGRSTFYAHFRHKDDLLDSSIRDVLRTVSSPPGSRDPVDRLFGFSLPLFRHIDAHRREDGAKMTRAGRAAIHRHLQDVLAEQLSVELTAAAGKQPDDWGLPVELIARYIAGTFALVLNWWIEREPLLTPEDADERFRRLVAALPPSTSRR